MFFPVPLAHLALVTAPVTRAWLCSIPAPAPPSPSSPQWESRVMTAAAAAPRTAGNMAAAFLCSKLEMASCGPGPFLDSSGKQGRTFVSSRGCASLTRLAARCPSGQTLDESINGVPSTLTARFYSRSQFSSILAVFLNLTHGI